jgi:hypothetical protein
MKLRPRPTLLISLALAALSGLSPGRAQDAKPSPFGPGESLTYEVTWSVFSAGDVVATLHKAGGTAEDPYEAITTARSRGFASLLFKVDNEFHSVFDPQTLCSRQISKKINEGHRRRQGQIVFDSARRLAVLDERDLADPNAPPKHAENEIPACVQDVVSAFYFVRHQNLQVGQELVVPVNDGSKTHQVAVEVQARERITTRLGSRAAFRVEPRVFGELYRRKGRLLIWFSDDEQRLPLRVKAMTSVGTITCTLKSVTTEGAAPPPQP